MFHASSWLGYSWDFEDLVNNHESESASSRKRGDGFGSSKVGRRSLFRASAGPSRECLQWMRLLLILRKVSKIPVLDFRKQEADLVGSHIQTQEDETNSTYRLTIGDSETDSNNVPSFKNLDGSLMHLLEEVMWPLETLGDPAPLFSDSIEWKKICFTADPVLGAGYKQLCADNGQPIRSVRHKAKLSHEHKDHCIGTEKSSGGWLGRGERKRWQVERIASALRFLQLQPGAIVVDFGCGSGALTLPLAAAFSELKFVGVDYKVQSVRLLAERARRASLSNVSGVYGRIENYAGPFDACVALHACGIATDLALLQAVRNRAAYVMSPCCVGKLQIPKAWTLQSVDSGGRKGCESSFVKTITPDATPLHVARGSTDIPKNGGGACRTASPCHQMVEESSEVNVSSNLVYPRSQWLRQFVTEKEYYVLARAADWSCYDFESFSSRVHLVCKTVLELDRNEASREVGYWTGLYNLENNKAGAVGVSHVLVGKPE